MRLMSLLLVCFVAALTAAAQNSTGWTLVWSDEFAQANGTSPDTNKWANDIGAGGWGNSELEYYTARTNNARIENGNLVIEAHQENFSGSSYTSARLKTQGKWSWTYGRVEARMKLPFGQGIWPAFWMLGTNINPVGWPTCGEIDIMENIGREPTIVHGTLHGPGYSGGGGISGSNSLPSNVPFADDFHVYSIEWTTNQIKWLVDNQQYFSVTPASLPNGSTWVFSQPQFILLNLAVGGQWPGYPDGTTTFPQRMTVDYVRVYAPANLSVCSSNSVKNAGFESSSLTNWTAYGAGFNTLLENIRNVQVHDGTNVFKVFGQFSGGENYSGVTQNLPATAGQSLVAGGWVCTPAGDQIAADNTAWLEVTFRNASSNVLSLFRSAVISSNTPAGAWLNWPVTNQLNPSTFAITGSVTNLVAPANTSFVRYQIVFRQLANATGAVLFDDLNLTSGAGAEIALPVTAELDGNYLNLAFASLLGLTYQIRSKTSLTDPQWLALTNVVGDGAMKSVPVDLQASSRFYSVTRACN